VNRGHAVCPFNHFCMRTLSRDEICTLQGSQDGCSDDAWCLPGDACDRGGGVNRCTDVREPCWANSDCEAGQWCNGKDFDASQGACAPAGVLEAPCLSLVDPTADCDEGLLCIDGECTRVAQSGESCNQPGTVCEAGLTCRSGVCGPPAEQGEACDAGECGEGLGCGCVDLWGTSCTCEPRKPLGESCFVFDECESRVCDGFDRNGGPGTCQPGFCAL
jgi:hypothetical protein